MNHTRPPREAPCCSAEAEAGQRLPPAAPLRSSALATVLSLPWCCIVPAALSLLSLSGALAARVWLARLAWVLLPLSAVLLGRAFWLLYAEHRGGPWTRRLTWAATLVAVAVWAPRLWAWLP